MANFNSNKNNLTIFLAPIVMTPPIWDAWVNLVFTVHMHLAHIRLPRLEPCQNIRPLLECTKTMEPSIIDFVLYTLTRRSLECLHLRPNFWIERKLFKRNCGDYVSDYFCQRTLLLLRICETRMSERIGGCNLVSFLNRRMVPFWTLFSSLFASCFFLFRFFLFIYLHFCVFNHFLSFFLSFSFVFQFFSFIFFRVPFSFFFFFHLLSFTFNYLHFSFSFIFYHFPSFSFIFSHFCYFFHFLSFFVIFFNCWGAQKSDFFASISWRFLLTLLMQKKSFFWALLGR